MLALAAFSFAFAANPYLDRVLVLINADSSVSVSLGADYLKQRLLRERLLVHCQDSSVDAGKETITYENFRDQIETPLRAYLAKHPKIDFIVLTKGIPIRIQGAPTGLGNNRPSLDSYLAALDYDKIPGAFKIVINESNFKGTCWANRFWDSKERFSHSKFGGYLVTRLDGYTEDDARMLVRYSLQSEKEKPSGTILLDSKSSYPATQLTAQPVPVFARQPDPANPGKAELADLEYKHYDMDMNKAAEVLNGRVPVQLDTAPEFVTGQDLMGYCSWGSNDPKFNADNYHRLRFAPGGIAETAVSTSGRTFLPTKGGQSLIADLIQDRVTGVKGYCDEPLLTAIASPTILFDRYTKGWTLAESFYAASRWTGWEDIVIGDPICQPYGR
ncbi:MAG TPA: TIGR03790 family protein [Fimbriimonadaceae bacterium]|nr:TIGR03790 family protein [Fimbriimonadaceae bacterium]